MLKGLDKGLAIASWIAAGLLALMLLIGPRVIADDKGKAPPASAAGKSPYAATSAASAPAAADGKKLFADKCGSCHTLSAAGTSGAVGPKLDGLGLDVAAVKAKMKAGGGVMPSFSSLSATDTDAIAKFVSASSK